MDLITFDLDMTLIKANKCHWHAFNDAFVKHGLGKISFNKLNPLLDGRRAHEIVKDFFPKLGKRKIHEIVKEHHRLIGVKYGKFAKRIKGVVGALKKIKKKYKLGIVTNCTHQEINGLLKGAGIDRKLFNVIVGQDDVKHSKPFPNEIFKAEKLTHLDVKFHVGDSPYDIVAARRAKTKAIGVLTGVTSKKKLMKEKPFKILKSTVDLPKYLKQLLSVDKQKV